MALRATPLRCLAHRLLTNSQQAVSLHTAQPLAGGGGGPVAFAEPVSAPLEEEDELVWQDGTANPEPCLDDYKLVTTPEACAWLAGGLSTFVLLYYGCKLHDKASKMPYAPKTFPYDNLRLERGKGSAGLLSSILPSSS